MIKDIWEFIKGLPTMWKLHRDYKKGLRLSIKMENEIGATATFLYFFELNMDHLPPELNRHILQEFLIECSVDMVQDEDFMIILHYAKSYDINVKRFEVGV